MASLAQEAKRRQLAVRVLQRLAAGESGTGVDFFGDEYGEYWCVKFLKRVRKAGLVTARSGLFGKPHTYSVARNGALDPYLNGPDKSDMLEALLWGRGRVLSPEPEHIPPPEAEADTDASETDDDVDPAEVAEATLKLLSALLEQNQRLAEGVGALNEDLKALRAELGAFGHSVANTLNSTAEGIEALRKQWE